METINQISQDDAMSKLVQVRQAGQLTLPAAARKLLRLSPGDWLEAEVREGSLVLKPVTVTDRKAGWEAVRKAQASVRYIGPEPRPSSDEEEGWVAETVREHRDSEV